MMPLPARTASTTEYWFAIRDGSELDSVIAALAREPNSGVIAMPDSFTIAYRLEIISLADRYRLPAVYPYRFFAEVGGLLSYGVDLVDNYGRVATYVDRILKGENPSELGHIAGAHNAAPARPEAGHIAGPWGACLYSRMPAAGASVSP
jgi:putative ABC transport system substrate-binding protein